MRSGVSGTEWSGAERSSRNTAKHCPKCNGLLGERRFKGRMMGYRCTNAECGYETRGRQRDAAAPADGEGEAPAEASS
jgi:ssDNA-binding Zn-finger/Zn-ribbon topoisomerase 1